VKISIVLRASLVLVENIDFAKGIPHFLYPSFSAENIDFAKGIPHFLLKISILLRASLILFCENIDFAKGIPHFVL